jgi:hypothetical protein
MKDITRQRNQRVKDRFLELLARRRSSRQRFTKIEIYEQLAEEEHLAPETIKQIVVNRDYSLSWREKHSQA